MKEKNNLQFNLNNKIFFINYKGGFTFIELIISISILAVLSVLWFISYSKNIEDTRDSQRESDVLYIVNALKLHKTIRWNYPYPWDSVNIINNWTLVATQWKMNNEVILSTMSNIPLDPFVKIPYTYSIWRNKQEFQIAATRENNWVNKSSLKWDYKVVSRDVLPTIILAIYWTGEIEINELISSWVTNRTKFIFDNSTNNLPYTFSYPFLPYSDNTSFTWLLYNPWIEWVQNNDYKNCNEIFDADKNIGTWVYQVNNYWTLQNINCTSSYIPKNCKEIKENNPLSSDWQYTIMPDWVSNFFTVYCDMTTSSWWWTLVAKDWKNFIYTVGHCNFMNPTDNNVKEDSFIYWACDLNQTEMLFWTPTWWAVWKNKVNEDCWTRSTKVNNNTCSWTWVTSQTFDIKELGWCMSGAINPIGWWLWWRWWDWETTVLKNLSWLSTTFSWWCNDTSWDANTSYCNLFDIYDNSWNWIWQWWGYRYSNCTNWYVNWSTSPDLETHLIFVR
jgi:prepilin-type N-terminal cleavage/methylation domain-containing protein